MRRTNRRRTGTTSRSCARFRATRPSSPWRRAAARWPGDGAAGPPDGAGMMVELLGIPPQVLFGQLQLGLINGPFYAMLSLGLAVVFRLPHLNTGTASGGE